MSLRLSGQRGQALVEFAVVLPVLLAFLLGIISFGQFENDASGLTSISAQAARNASINQNPGASQSLQTYSAAQASGNAAGNTTVTLTCNGSCASTNGTSTVTASACASVSLLVGTFKIVQRTTMRVEQAQTAWTSPSTTGWTPDASQCS